MKLIKSICASALLVSLLASCSVTMPMDTTNNAIGSKTGVSSTMVIFGYIYLNGSYGVQDACKNGGIKGVTSTLDEKTSNFVIFQKKELIVTGE